MGKLLTREQLQKVERDLEKRGAKVETFVIAHPQKNDVLWELDKMRIRFPNGRRWDIVEIDYEGGE